MEKYTGRFGSPAQRGRFGSHLRYIPPSLAGASPNVFHAVGGGAGVQNVPLPAASPSSPTWQGVGVWAFYLGGNGGDAPSWVLNDTSVISFGAVNLATVFGDNASNVKGYVVTVPATAVAVQIGGGGTASALLLWRAGNLNVATEPSSAVAAPFHYVPTFTRLQAYVIGACISAAPSMSTIPGLIIGSIGGQTAMVGASPNTHVGGVFPCDYGGTPGGKVGFIQAYTDSKPPVLA